MLRKHRILYVSHLGYGATGLQRMNALRDIGQDVIPFGTQSYGTDTRIDRRIQARLSLGKAVRSLNVDLLAFARESQYDMVWIEKGIWIYPETVEDLREARGAMVIHYTPDMAITFNKTRHFMRSIPKYDAVITTKRYEMEKYKEHGAKCVIFIGKAFDPGIHKPYALTAQELRTYGSDVCFVGRCERHYFRLVRAVAHATDGLAIWADQWKRKTFMRPWLKKAYRGGNVWESEYGKALSGAKIGLGFLTKLGPETATARSIEIPACGTLLLAERTNEHQELFQEGKEAEFFDNEEELREKIKYYLSHPDERERIAVAGRKRCVQSDYTHQSRLKAVFERISELTSYNSLPRKKYT